MPLDPVGGHCRIFHRRFPVNPLSMNQKPGSSVDALQIKSDSKLGAGNLQRRSVYSKGYLPVAQKDKSPSTCRVRILLTIDNHGNF
jgi:hypothetical protein